MINNFIFKNGKWFADKKTLYYNTNGEYYVKDKKNVCYLTDSEVEIFEKIPKFGYELYATKDFVDFDKGVLKKHTNQICNRCKCEVVFENKIKEYPYYCPNCYENMYLFETTRK
jgi:hypothetical protein